MILQTRTTIVAAPPLTPIVTNPPPKPPSLVVVPSPGPQGPPGSSGAGFVFQQETPATVVDIHHGLHRDGPVFSTFWALDYSIEWDGVVTQRLSQDAIRVSFDDPTSFICLIT